MILSLLKEVSECVREFEATPIRIYDFGARNSNNIAEIISQSEEENQIKIQKKQLLFLLIDQLEMINSCVKFHKAVMGDCVVDFSLASESDAYLLLVSANQSIESAIYKRDDGYNFQTLLYSCVEMSKAIVFILTDFYKADFEVEFTQACLAIKDIYRHRNNNYIIYKKTM